MAKIRKKYNPQKTIMYNLQKTIKMNNIPVLDKVNGLLQAYLETVAYLYKTNIISDELLSRLVHLAHFFEIIIVYKQEKLHYFNHIKPQFKKNGLINLDFFVEEATKLKEIIKPLILQDKRKKIKLNESDIQLIENMTDYVVDFLKSIKCKITICELLLYTNQQDKLFLLNYPKLYNHYKKSCKADMILLSKYIINKEEILTKHLLQNKYAIFNESTYSFDFIDKKELNNNYELTSLQGVVKCVN